MRVQRRPKRRRNRRWSARLRRLRGSHPVDGWPPGGRRPRARDRRRPLSCASTAVDLCGASGVSETPDPIGHPADGSRAGNVVSLAMPTTISVICEALAPPRALFHGGDPSRSAAPWRAVRQPRSAPAQRPAAADPTETPTTASTAGVSVRRFPWQTFSCLTRPLTRSVHQPRPDDPRSCYQSATVLTDAGHPRPRRPAEPPALTS